jgi:hypothetical protein
MEHVCNPSYTRDINKRITVRGQPWAKTIEKTTKAKKGWGMAPMVECLPSSKTLIDS